MILPARPDFEVCAKAETWEEVVEKTRELDPDLVIFDITLPVINGLDTARIIRAFGLKAPIVVLTVHKSRQFVEEARKIGVQGYVTKADASQSLLNAIQAVGRGFCYFPSDS